MTMSILWVYVPAIPQLVLDYASTLEGERRRSTEKHRDEMTQLKESHHHNLLEQEAQLEALTAEDEDMSEQLQQQMQEVLQIHQDQIRDLEQRQTIQYESLVKHHREVLLEFYEEVEPLLTTKETIAEVMLQTYLTIF